MTPAKIDRMPTPAEIDRLPLEELRRLAHHQRCLITAFRRQNNNQRNRIRDLEQQIETMDGLSGKGAMEDEISFQGDERGTPPKRRYSLDLAMQGDGPQAMADALYDLATDLLHGSFPGHRVSGGYDVGYRAELVENDPTMTHERYVEELEAYLSGSSEVSDG